MRRSTLTSLTLLIASMAMTACAPVIAPPPVLTPKFPKGAFTPCRGYSGPVPRTDVQLALAATADRGALACTSSKLVMDGKIINAAP